MFHITVLRLILFYFLLRRRIAEMLPVLVFYNSWEKNICVKELILWII